MPKLEEVLPKYLQIAGHIRDQIVRGDLPPGAEIPSERALAAEWKVARPTATKAIESLRIQGFVESRQGSGTFVIDTTSAPRSRERHSRAHERGTMYSDAESVEFIETALIEEPPPRVLEALRLPSTGQAIKRVRLISREGAGPVELSTSWFAGEMAEIAPLLLVPERLRGGTAKYIAEVGGPRQTSATDRVQARSATPEEARLLGLEPSAPVLAYELIAWDAAGVIVQFDESTYPPGRWAFSQEYALDA